MEKPVSIPNPKTTFSLIFIKALFFCLGFALAAIIISLFFAPNWGQYCYDKGYREGKEEATFILKDN